MTRGRWIAALSPLGAAALAAGTLLHPASADPSASADAFREYAASSTWLASHLLQLLGAALLLTAVSMLARSLGSEVALVAERAAVVTLALAAALQAVDGVALKAMAEAWSRAAEPSRASLFAATLAVRQIEIGLAAVGAMSMGATALLIAAALRQAAYGTPWLAGLAAAGGSLSLVAGVLMGTQGFSPIAMDSYLASSGLLLAWWIGIAWSELRR